MSNQTTLKISRREFLRIAAVTAGAAIIAACAPTPAAPVVPNQPAAAPTSIPPAPPTSIPPTVAPAVTVPPVVQTNTQVTWWRSLTGSNGDMLEAMVKDFNASQKAVTVKSEYQGVYADLRDKLSAAVAAGPTATPDLVMLSTNNYTAFARNKVLEPLDAYLKGSSPLDLADFYPLVDAGRMNGSLYSLPEAVSTPVFYYNEDAIKKAGFDGPPKTWDDFFDVYSPKLTVKDAAGKTQVYAFDFDADNSFWWQQSYVWSYGGKLDDDQWNVYLDSPEVIDFLTRMQKLFQSGGAILPTAATGNDITIFGNGNAAMMIQSTGILVRIDDAAGGRFKAGVTQMPMGPKGRQIAFGGAGVSIMANAKPEKKQAAWEFIRWLQQPQQIARWTTASGYLPYTKASAAAMADVLAKDSRRKIAVDQLAYSRSNSPTQTVPRVNDPFYDAMIQICNLKADPKVIMPQIQKQAQAILIQDGFKKP